MKPVIIHRLAQKELHEAVTYYDQQSFGLGRDLNKRIKQAVETISTQPKRFAFLNQPPFRAVRLKRFPYRIIYAEHEDHIWVVAISHDKRHPDYWRKRKHD
jgi:toxin ParE1/3/4